MSGALFHLVVLVAMLPHRLGESGWVQARGQLSLPTGKLETRLSMRYLHEVEDPLKHRKDPLGKRKIFCDFQKVILLVKVLPKCRSHFIDPRKHECISNLLSFQMYVILPTFEASLVVSSSLGHQCDSCEAKEHPFFKPLAVCELMLRISFHSRLLSL